MGSSAGGWLALGAFIALVGTWFTDRNRHTYTWSDDPWFGRVLIGLGALVAIVGIGHPHFSSWWFHLTSLSILDPSTYLLAFLAGLVIERLASDSDLLGKLIGGIVSAVLIIVGVVGMVVTAIVSIVS